MKRNKTIILHDTFLYKWWWERLILMMTKALNCDLASWFFSKWSFDLKQEWIKWKIISVSSEIFKSWFRHIKLKLAFLFKTKFLRKYETVIFSWDCISAVRNCRKNTKKVYYCHTPPRYLYDLRKEYLNKTSFFVKPFFNIFSYFFRKMYESDIKKMDIIITNSENTRARLKKFIWLDSIVLYPPVELNKFKFLWNWDYYISVSRLSTAKRIDKIVKAFSKMPSKKLIVIYWENDPQKDEIFKLAKNNKNISFVTCPWNKWFTDYVWNSVAGICIPINEDFWMVPVESMSAWKPVLWVNEWWLKETIIHEKTWYLIPKWAKVKDIIKAVNYLTPKKCLSMRENCEKRAREFSYEEFEIKLKRII
jgi:glycosyltransferase involved in cell wall biosynthesis